MIYIAQFLVLVMAVEAITEVIVDSKLTGPFRGWLGRKAMPLERNYSEFTLLIYSFFFNLLNCGYCTSVWIGGAFAFFAPQAFESDFLNWVVMTFSLHRMANWLHVVFMIIKKGRVKTIDFEFKKVPYGT